MPARRRCSTPSTPPWEGQRHRRYHRRCQYGTGRLDGPADCLAAGPKVTGIKLGFCDDKLRIDTSALPEAERFALSQKLRGAFTAKLVELGVDGTLLWGKRHDQDKPVADNATEEGKVLNRRMEFAAIR